MGTHAKLSPSGADRWSNCGGSLDLAKDIPEEESSFADEGHRAHDLAALFLRERLGEVPDGTGELVYSNHKGLYTAEMKTAAIEWADFVSGWARGSRSVYVEHVWIKNRDSYGTADAVVLSKDGTHLLVADFKYGAGIPVVAKKNKQMNLYADAVLRQTGPFSRVKHVELVVFQPRIAEIGFDSDLRSRDEVVEFASQIYVDGAKNRNRFKSGDWCRFCRARAVCDTLKNDVSRSTSEGQHLLEASDDAKAIAAFLENDAPQLSILVRALEGKLKTMIEQGVAVSGWRVSTGRTHRKWRNQITIETLREWGFTGDMILPTPKQVEDATGKKLPKDMTQTFETTAALRKDRARKGEKLLSKPAPRADLSRQDMADLFKL